LKTYSNSTANINGGNLNFNMFDISGTLNIYRGALNVDDFFSPLPQTGVVNVYGNGFNYNSSTQILTGYLLDSNQFTIRGINSSEYTRFNLIPEPISVLLFGFGLLALRKQK
jgi:hypothetical protein